MRTLTVKTHDSNVCYFPGICKALSGAYGWTDYSVQDEETVKFTMDGEEFKGEMAGYEFDYSDSNGYLVGCLDWMEAVGASYVVRAEDEDGKDVFLLID